MPETQITDHDALFAELTVELDEKTRELEALKRVPGGPWKAMECLAGWFVMTVEPHRRFGGENTSWMTELEAIAVRDALNRLKGEGEKDGLQR